ncbi:hypothetical protein ASPBRDRAFT_84380, partial [Aspergillus brasiliensis CBS 101740]
TPFFWAAAEGHDKVLQLLLGTGAVDPNIKDAKRGQSAICAAAEGGHESVVARLLGVGVDCHAADSQGKTPLAYAVEKGSASILDILLKAGADPNVKD